METLASIAPDAAISPRPDSAAAVPGLAPPARAHPATIKGPRDAGRAPATTANIATTADVLPASQESNISVSSSASYAPPLLSSQSNVSTESIVETEHTSPATSNVSSQCPPSSLPAAPHANQEDNQSPPRTVTPQPAPTPSGRPRNASTGSPMAVDTPTIPQGTKRTASGAVKLPASTTASTLGLFSSDMSRNTSASSSLSRMGKLSADLKTRLSYAMIKVQNGWEQKSIVELESAAASSQRTSPAAASQTPTSATRFRNATASPHAFDRRRRCPSGALSDPSDRYAGTPGAQGSPPGGLRTFGPTSLAGYLDTTRTADDDARPDTASTFSSSSSAPTTTLAPTLDSSPPRRHHRRSTSSHIPPMLGAARVKNKPLTSIGGGAPATPASGATKPPPPPTQRPVSILRMPSQQAEMDAVDSLLFMSSPNNSAHLAHTSTSATSTAVPSPLRPEFPAAKRVAFDDRRSRSSSNSNSNSNSEAERERTSPLARGVQTVGEQRA